MKAHLTVLEVWTVQFGGKRPWINTPVLLVIIERSPSSVDACGLSKDLFTFCHLCVHLGAGEEKCGSICAWEQSLLYLMNHRFMATLILHR